MKSKLIHIFLFSFVLFFSNSCKEPAPQVPANKLEKRHVAEDLMEMNRQFAELENEEIEKYIDSLHLDLKKTATGMRYKIVKEGIGDSIQSYGNITFRYSIRLFDGTKCEELTDVVKTLDFEKGDVLRGIREALPLLKVSGSGYFIFPSQLAYGVVGYPKCIPGWTPVICEITLIDYDRMQ